MNKLSKAVLVALGLATLASCGGGDGGIAAGGTGGTGISQGSVSGFGSVYINGVKFNTDASTTTTVEDSVGTGQTGLKLGMVATVEWEKDATTGKYRARTIKYSDDVQGPFTVADATTLTVLGQTVIVSPLTVFEGDDTISVTSLAELPPDRVVEVSGLRDDTGAIRATRIELKAAGTAEYELKGVVSSASAPTFTLGTQVVSFAGTLPPNGACVEAKGTLSGSTLVATEVKIDDSCALGGTMAANMEVELEGYISDFSTSGFKVNGQSVQVNSATEYDDKGLASNSTILVNGARVEVEGKMNSSGVLVATKVSLDPELGERPESSIEMEIPASLVVVPSTTTLTVFGITVTVNDSTRCEDGILRDLSNIGDRDLEIDAYPNDTGAIIATRIRHKSASTPLLQGPVSAEGNNSLTILGVTVDTSGAVYQNINGTPMSSAEFFAAVNTGTLVKAKGAVSGNLMTATELEIED